MMKRTITISSEELPKVAQKLLDQMVLDGFVPDAVVGIATGGWLVVESLPSDSDFARFICTLQRRSTATKQHTGLAMRILKLLPYSVTDLLRVVEDRIGERAVPAPRAPSPSLAHSLADVGAEVRARGLRNIAVIDDAVDSGATLACVISELARCVPSDVTIRTGAITRTRSPERTIVAPDYVVFENTLCRFHWSYDYRPSSNGL